ncbi:Uncharacterized protein FKW44_023053 [Caligus rogercresseyi]|uniref:Uncharacterized protein n=1 Tax=Caligus rogercresseyi TaxID=217165 RepID=A0A7T8JUU7_CALRO|nr:Uncharacterized protein FKW44_023053 [Caligus rogercresseyi]
MICILAATNQESNPIFQAFGNDLDDIPFENDAAEIGFEYRVAAKVGHMVRDHRKCEFKYKCSMDTKFLMEFSKL